MRAGSIANHFGWLAVLALVAVGAVGCSEADEPVAGDQGMDLTTDQVARLKNRALSGDNNAAETLSVYYGNLQQKSEQMRWLELSASRGNCNSLTVILEIKYTDDEPQGDIDKWEQLAGSLHCTYDRKLMQSFRPTH